MGAGSSVQIASRGLFPPTPWSRTLFIVFAVLFVTGLIGMWQRMTQGHLPAGYGSYVPWGLWIAIYFHGVGIAGGAFVIGALAFIFRVPGLSSRNMLRAAIIVSFAAMIPAFLAVWLDLGRMDRSHRIMTSPSFTSMMAFNAWMYMVFLGVAFVAWLLSFRRESGWLRPVLVLGAVFAIMIPSQSGAFFGVVDAKPYWSSALLPILFMISGLTAGIGILLFVRAALGRHAFWWAEPDAASSHDLALGRLRRWLIAGICVYIVLEFAEFSIALWTPGAAHREIELVLLGPYWWVFWVVHLALGTVLPLVLLLFSRKTTAWAIAAVLVAVTLLTSRLNVLIPGQAVPELAGLQDAFRHPRLDHMYHATAMEYLVGLFLVAIGMGSYWVLRRVGAVIAFRRSSVGAAEPRS